MRPLRTVNPPYRDRRDAGQALALNVAVQRLREAQLLGKNSSSLKLLSQLGELFELLPADKPSQVRLRR